MQRVDNMVLEAICKAQAREDFALNDAAVISLALDLRDARRAIQRAMVNALK